MHSTSPDDAYKREIAPQQRKRTDKTKPDVYEEQEDQSFWTQLFIFATISGMATSIW